jgi:ABC-type transporter Mla subunit MlaD
VFPALFNEGEFLQGHWAIVIGVALAFLLVQLLLCIRVYLRLREQDAVLADLCCDFEEGGDGCRLERQVPDHFTWIDWVFSIFPPSEPVSPGNMTRDDVLRELDVRIAGDSSYLLLQRMGVMAPLLGVVLTVISFYWLKIDEAQSQSLSSILLALTPLVSGVGAGAVLALINQVLLHAVGRRIELLRLSAREWFDAVIWAQLPMDSQAVEANAVATVERFSRSMSEAADRYTAGAQRIDDCTGSMTAAARHFHEVVQSFGTDIKGIPAALCDVRDATAESASALRDLVPVNARAVAGLDVSVSAFRSTVDREFSAAATRHEQSSQTLAEAIERISAAAEGLKSGSNELNQTAVANTAFFERMQEILGPYLVEPHGELHQAAKNLTAQTNDIHAAAASLTQTVNAISDEFSSITGVLAPAILSLRDAIENNFEPAVIKQRKQIASVGRSVRRLRTAAEDVADGTTTLNAMLNECSSFLEQARSTREAIAGVSGSLTNAVRQLQSVVSGTVAPVPPAMHEAVASISESAARLVEFVEQGLEPTVEQVAILERKLSEFETSVKSIPREHSAPDGNTTSNVASAFERTASRTGFARRPR